MYISPFKLNYLFDGLGQIFAALIRFKNIYMSINCRPSLCFDICSFKACKVFCIKIMKFSSQFMTRMTEDDRKRVCRNIYSVQKSLNNVTGRPENDLARAQMYYDLLKKEPDQILGKMFRLQTRGT